VLNVERATNSEVSRFELFPVYSRVGKGRIKPREMKEKQTNHCNDFDFLIGSWHVHHRRLKERLENSCEWIEFEGTCITQRILGGAGNIDEHSLDFPGDPYRAVAIRTYDATKRQWSIWWIDGRNPSHLDPPLVGGFKDGAGMFYAEDTFAGKSIQIRFLWTDLTTQPHWEQAFSEDGGKTWETNWTMQFVKTIFSAKTCCPIVELRQYTLVPGQRETLIALFEREFVETQEVTGMRLIGQFRDLRTPDRFVWLRGFSDMDSRALQLEAFYGGPVWKAHRDAANATMIDSNNVLLLRPTSPTSGFQLQPTRRVPPGSGDERDAVLVAAIYYLNKTKGEEAAAFFERELRPKLAEAGIAVLASFITETRPNSFPRLPVREDANVLVWFARFNNHVNYEEQSARMVNRVRQSVIEERLSQLLAEPPEVLMLQPTTRSLLR
jgi:NIPSNAP